MTRNERFRSLHMLADWTSSKEKNRQHKYTEKYYKVYYRMEILKWTSFNFSILSSQNFTQNERLRNSIKTTDIRLSIINYK